MGGGRLMTNDSAVAGIPVTTSTGAPTGHRSRAHNSQTASHSFVASSGSSAFGGSSPATNAAATASNAGGQFGTSGGRSGGIVNPFGTNHQMSSKFGGPSTGGLGNDQNDETPRLPFATPEDFENMVGDLRRTFIGWLKKTEGELRRERDAVKTERREFEDARTRAWKDFVAEKQAEYEKLQEDRRKLDLERAASMKQIAIEREDAQGRIHEERNKFEREKEVLKRQVAREREQLMQEFESFEVERRKILDASIAVESTVDINVGGVVFEASRHILTQQAGSLLEAIFSGRHRMSRDRAGRIFLDRDAELFRVLLQFLRNPGAPPTPRDAVESAAIAAEAEYYGIKFFPFPLVFAIGGHNGVEHLSQVEILDVGQQCWRPCQGLQTPRTYFGASAMTGRLFAFGGQNFEYKSLCDVEVYDVLRDVWMSGPPLHVPRRNTCGATLGNRVFAIGGFDGANILSSVESYDPRMKNWMEIPHLLTPRSSPCCTAIGDSIYVAGGTTGERLRTVERFDSRANCWEKIDAPMIEVRSAAAASGLLNSVYVIGGTDSAQKILSSMEVMDTGSRKWMFLRNMPEARMDLASVVTCDSVMVTGGQDSEVYNSTIFYRTELDEWQTGPPMLFPRYGHSLLVSNC